MSDADDDRGQIVAATFSSLPGLIALGALIGSAGVAYVRDLRAAIEQLFGRGGLEAALRAEHARVKANVLALAVIADGAITPAEHETIAQFAASHGIEPDEAIAKLTSVADEVRDPVVLREKVARYAAPLDANERLEVFVVVKNLAHRGSRAWPEEAGYRGAHAPTPEALIAAFRDALGIRSADE